MKFTWQLMFAIISVPCFAHGAIVPSQQSRSVQSFGSASTIDASDSDSSSSAASGFGPFDDLVGIAVRVGSVSADGFAQQTSSIGQDDVTALLSADAFVGAFGFDDTADAGSTSSFELTFTVDKPAQYLLEVSGSASNNGFASMQLDSDPPSEAAFYYDATFEQPPLTAFNLEPGFEYRLIATASASGFFAGGDGQIDGRAGVNFALRQVPEPSTWGLLATGTIAVLGCGVVRGRRAV
jgi:hypothetical protein